MDLKRRKRWSLALLLIGLPIYVVLAVSLVNWMDRSWGRQPILVELAVYVALGVLWALPFRRLFSGIGKGE
ncbi:MULTISPECIES: DUF2842 domain-containing protein [unclassified Paracoccus (in: a-proteobacteria)]|uniref:DUF2842 domain-containing protein n=1 Tax=unclassified Paracoccus (in: a-proteobacteria) TaxID=2688777 RepID=UPI0012B419E6|nr:MULTISPECIES: DUF2842 domain-containing protein [unclassified Paracoccus (in: a-proteobacteria)]UXU75241.1 DUF2842 domain-containing protein [Paracoccus sp. SMMA_5]UXU81142.1 DUF2842 domain-containing protein [Paracoccus sp. SMMA_5_TC]